MSSSKDSDYECEFEHTFEVKGSSPVADKIRSGEISSLEDLKEEMSDEADPYSLVPVMGDHYKKVKVSSGNQGTPYTFILVSADSFDDDMDWEIAKTDEKIFVSPHNTMHQELMQRRQQAEQNIKTQMQGLEQLRKQKHMLEHDIRKLRSKVEDLQTGQDEVIKGDFVQLVDGAGAGGQGSDEQALRFLRDNNIYPTIVGDFNEMDSVEDLEEGGKLSNLPANEKAILKKKYIMYEKWKDMYGSEIQRKLKELKKELKRIERAIEETKEWLAPYVRDMEMINQKTQDELGADLSRYMTFTGYATMYKQMEFIAYQGLRNEEGRLHEEDDKENITHYKIFHLHAVHVNISGGGNPNSPAEGPTAGVVFWRPALVCKHVFENIFKQKIDKHKKDFDQLMDDYTGENFETKEGNELQEKRIDKGIEIRELREKVSQKLEEKDTNENVPLDFSALIRRIEDGFDKPQKITEKYSKHHLEAVDEILGTEFTHEHEHSHANKKREKFKEKIKKFTGSYNNMHIEDPKGELKNLENEFKFGYYYDLKIGLDLYTMK